MSGPGRRAGRGERWSTTAGGAPAPARLEAWRVDAEDGEFVIFEWPATTPVMPRSLTAAERAVALLALRGLTNRDIARLRGVSARTVANQLASVFRKMGVGSRRELVARMGAAG